MCRTLTWGSLAALKDVEASNTRRVVSDGDDRKDSDVRQCSTRAVTTRVEGEGRRGEERRRGEKRPMLKKEVNSLTFYTGVALFRCALTR